MNLENALENHADGAEVQALAPDNAEVLLKNSPEPRNPGFQPGNRANPRGRPPGTYSRRMSPLKRLLDAESPEILKKVTIEAKAGNMQAAAIILSRTLPKERLVAIGKMPKVTDAASAMKALGLLFECASSGAITTAEANNLGALARSFVEIDAVAQLKEQVAALEARMAAPQ
jgi:hypothetical protein